MEPYCREDYQMQPILLHPLTRMIMMMEIKDDDAIITVEIVMVIEEITEVVEVVEVEIVMVIEEITEVVEVVASIHAQLHHILYCCLL